MLCCNWSQEMLLSSYMRNGGPNLRGGQYRGQEGDKHINKVQTQQQQLYNSEE